MKKTLMTLFLCAAMALSITACNKDNEHSDTDSSDGSSYSKEPDKSSDPESDSESSSDPENIPIAPVIDPINWDLIPEAPEEDFEYEPSKVGYGVKIVKYLGEGGDVNIPGSLGGKYISDIGWGAFRDCKNLKSVNIPDSLILIGTYAFDECTGLENVTIPEGVTGIDSLAFNNCTSLKTIVIPDTVTFFGGGTFWGCTNLEYVKFSDDVLEIRNNEFKDCPNVSIAYRGKIYTQSTMDDFYNAIRENELATVK